MRAPVGFDEFFDAPREPVLQFLLVLQPFPLHEGLAGRIVFPGVLRHLIAANVNVFAGEQLKHFRQHVIQKFEGFVVGRVVDAVDNPRL